MHERVLKEKYSDLSSKYYSIVEFLYLTTLNNSLSTDGTNKCTSRSSHNKN